jgi:hypothetical protein
MCRPKPLFTPVISQVRCVIIDPSRADYLAVHLRRPSAALLRSSRTPRPCGGIPFRGASMLVIAPCLAALLNANDRKIAPKGEIINA